MKAPIWLAFLATFAVGGCAILSDETVNSCTLAEDMYQEFVNHGAPPELTEIGTQVGICLAGVEKDSKDWELKLARLEQSIRDALREALGGIWPFLTSSEMEQNMQRKRAAELQVQLDGFR